MFLVKAVSRQPISRFLLFGPATSRSFHTTAFCFDLMEFFDDKKNWGEINVITGRSWQLAELRSKSSVDLHKLWYLLLKERNMLLTMEEDASENLELFPNPERIDKVEESMERLQQVVRERNKAFLQLEVSEDAAGEPPHSYVTTFLGFRAKKYLREYLTPPDKNNLNFKEYEQPYLNPDVYSFQKLFRERLHADERDTEDDKLRREGKLKMIYPGLPAEYRLRGANPRYLGVGKEPKKGEPRIRPRRAR